MTKKERVFVVGFISACSVLIFLFWIDYIETVAKLSGK